jgi:hypothetical protein
MKKEFIAIAVILVCLKTSAAYADEIVPVRYNMREHLLSGNFAQKEFYAQQYRQFSDAQKSKAKELDGNRHNGITNEELIYAYTYMYRDAEERYPGLTFDPGGVPRKGEYALKVDGSNASWVSASHIVNKLKELKRLYRHGMEWGDEQGHCMEFNNILREGIYGSLEYFEESPPDSHIRIGDSVAYRTKPGEGHIAMVIDIDGNFVTFAEGNYNGKVSWRREADIRDLDIMYIISHYYYVYEKNHLWDYGK